MTEKKSPTVGLALIPIVVLIALLAANVIVFEAGATDGPNQIALLLGAAVAGVVTWRLGFTWEEMEKSIVKSISSAMGAMLILMVIGALSGTWLLSGIVPAMIYYGLKILNPTIFLFAACIVCCIVSLAQWALPYWVLVKRWAFMRVGLRVRLFLALTLAIK